MKLLKTERSINSYHIQSKNVAEEYNIDEIPIEILFQIVEPNADDPLLYEGQVLSREQFEKINDILAEKIIPDFNLYYYVLECSGIYDWDMKP
jgi:hypothetical protein